MHPGLDFIGRHIEFGWSKVPWESELQPRAIYSDGKINTVICWFIKQAALSVEVQVHRICSDVSVLIIAKLLKFNIKR